MMTAQVESAITKMKLAGVPRSWYSVRVEKIYAGKHYATGQSCWEYGDARITIYKSYSVIAPYAKRLARAGLHVRFWKFDSGWSLYVRDKHNNSGLWFDDYTKCDKYGLPKRRRLL